MLEHVDHIVTAAPGFAIEGGRLLGSVGSGGIAIALTTVLVAGTREPKGGGGEGGGKKGRMRKRLTSQQAQVIGVAAGTLYTVAGSIWTVGGNLSDAFSSVFTGGAFGAAGLGAVSLLLAGVMYFRELTPGKSAFLGILSAGVWAQAGGIWGLPEALVLTSAGALGIS